MRRRDRRSISAWLVPACLVLAAACTGGPQDAETDAADESVPPAEATDPGEEVEDEEEPAEPSVVPLPRSNVEIYFPSVLQTGLIGEFREIFDTATPGDRAKQIVADLIEGPTNEESARVLPARARLRQAFVLPDGAAYLDFSAELTEGLGGGSMAELLAVYSIVNSVVLNVPEIERVAILVGGRSVDTLNGHIDLRRPLRPDPSLILGSITARDSAPGRNRDTAGEKLAALAKGTTGGTTGSHAGAIRP